MIFPGQFTINLEAINKKNPPSYLSQLFPVLWDVWKQSWMSSAGIFSSSHQLTLNLSMVRSTAA